MRYRVLGPITAHGEDGPLRLGGPKRCTVLAALLLNANRVVPEERLINLVWGDQPPSTARGGLQVHISELRALLGKEVVVRRSAGYLIRVEAGELDLQVFDEAVAQARSDFAAGSRETAAEGLRFALDLWNGPPLSGVADALANSEGPGLEERRLAAVEELFEVELATGRHAQQIGQLRQIADEHPFRERIQAQLMLALHRCGRTPEALRVYGETHHRLVEELGIEPGQQLQELHQRILSGDDQSPDQPPVEQHGTTVVAEHVLPAELPHDARGFTGRRDVLAELDPDDGLWVISGLPGVGKTALAVHWAHMVRERFTGGQLYLNLRGFEANHEPLTPSAALTQLLRTLGVTESTMPQTVDEQARLYRSLLADKKVLVLLDNARDTEQLLPLVPSSGTVLITSRNRLGDFVAQTGARSLSLHRLSEEDAQELLRTILGAERVEAEPEAALDLARLCDYLPLALRIAAANIGAVPHRRLADGVAELASGNPLDELSIDGAEESAVTTAFSVSYAALSPERQRLFRLLGLFPGPDFSPVAAAALADVSEREAIKGLKALTAANLVEQHAADRYRFHDLVRFFSAEQARIGETERDREQAWTRLVELYLGFSDVAAGQSTSQVARLPREREIPVRFPLDDEPACPEAEVSNVLALLPSAAKHGPYPAAWYLLDSAGTFLHSRERRLEWLNIAPGLLESAARRGERRVEAAIHRNSSMACLLIGHVEQCIHHLAEAVKASRESGWRECEAVLNVDIGAGLDWSGHLASATDNSIRALELFRAKGSVEGEAMALRTLGWQYRHLGQLELAQDYLTTALERTRAHGLEFWEMINLVEFGTTLHDLGRYDEAERCMVRTLEVFRRHEASRMEAWVLTNLSALRCDRGEFQQARAEAAHALDLGRQVNLKLVEADALTALGRAETFLGRLQQAEKYYRMALPIVRYVSHWHAGVLQGLARAHSRMGRDAEAVEQATRARALATEQGHRLLEVRAVVALAEAHARSGAHEDALAAAREVLEISGETGYERGKLQIQRLFEELDLPDAELVVFDCGA